MKTHWLLFGLLILALPAQVANAREEKYEEYYKIDVQIINKANLPPDRLADALYAKAILTENDGLLLQAAKLMPNDPVYLFQLREQDSLSIQDNIEDETDQMLVQSWQKTLKSHRSLLEKVLSIDPDYLPALYDYALTKPTHELKIQALEKIVVMDLDNAKPYYLMALLQYDIITKDRNATKESDLRAYPMTQQEWSDVMDLIKKGNARPTFRYTEIRVPAANDICVSIKGKIWPQIATQNYLRFLSNELMAGGLADSPLSFSFYARARQIARQAVWETRLLYRQGKRQEALNMLNDLYTFGEKLTASEPYRLFPFYVGKAIISMENSSERQILQVPADKENLHILAERRKSWGKAVEASRKVLPDSSIMVKGVMISPSESFTYTDFAIEEAGVGKILQDLGILPQKALAN